MLKLVVSKLCSIIERHMKKKDIIYTITVLGTMLLLDFIMIGVLRKNYFLNKIKDINKGQTTKKSTISKIISGVIVYATMVCLIVYFAKKKPLRAALLGAGVYAVFDGTLFIMSESWNVLDAAIDVAWGSFVFFSSTYAGTYASSNTC